MHGKNMHRVYAPQPEVSKVVKTAKQQQQKDNLTMNP